MMNWRGFLRTIVLRRETTPIAKLFVAANTARFILPVRAQNEFCGTDRASGVQT
jgi:hypothetical protein